MKKKFACVLFVGLFLLAACSLNQKSNVSETTVDNLEKVDFYLEVIDKLVTSDEALVYETKNLALDLSNSPLELDDEEMKTLKQNLEEKYNKEILFSDYESLVKEGMIDDEKGAWDDGALIKIEGKEKFENDELEFKCELWRSGSGAIYFEDCNAKWTKDGNLEGIEYGGEAIS